MRGTTLVLVCWLFPADYREVDWHESRKRGEGAGRGIV